MWHRAFLATGLAHTLVEFEAAWVVAPRGGEIMSAWIPTYKWHNMFVFVLSPTFLETGNTCIVANTIVLEARKAFHVAIIVFSGTRHLFLGANSGAGPPCPTHRRVSYYINACGEVVGSWPRQNTDRLSDAYMAQPQEILE